MSEPLSLAQWVGGRALVEGALPTHTAVAAAMGVHVTTVSHRAAEEGWKGLDLRRPRIRAAHARMVDMAARAAAGEEEEPDQEGTAGNGAGAAQNDAAAEPLVLEDFPDETPEQRIGRIADMISRQADHMLRRAQATGRAPDSRQIAGLTSLMEMAERLAPIFQETAAEEQERSDAEVAAALQKVEDRIVYLSKAYAYEMLVERGAMTREEADEAMRVLDGEEREKREKRQAVEAERAK